jgi:hypothetical protein|tara:strand:+ start:1055 stop:1435 length:381 start_codon:yes stop_codon:yes gene_type:complete
MLGTLQKYAIIAVAVTTIVGGISGVVWWQVKKIDNLIAENAVLEEVAIANAAAVEQLLDQARAQAELNVELSANMLSAEEKREEVLQIFRDHQLTNLATRKPEMIERIINNGTRKVFDNLESITAN